MLLYDHRDCTDYLGRGAQDGHLDFHTAPELCTLLRFFKFYDHRDCTDYLGRGVRDGHLDFHTAPEL